MATEKVEAGGAVLLVMFLAVPGSEQKLSDIQTVQFTIKLPLQREGSEGVAGQFYIQITVFVSDGYMGQGMIKFILAQIYIIGIDPNAVAVKFRIGCANIGFPLVKCEILCGECQPITILSGVPVEGKALVVQFCPIVKIPDLRLIEGVPAM